MARLIPARPQQGAPRQFGFRMPAEWEPHEATWLAWPHERTDWPGKFSPIPWVYAEIVRNLARVEKVRILVQDRTEEQKARRILAKTHADLARVELFRVPTDRGWIRDFGPIFLKYCQSGRRSAVPKHDLAFTNWRFNAWAKYDDWKKDARVPSRLAPALGVPYWIPQYQGRPVVLEGGSIDVNGRGTLLTTEECQLSPVQARNPGLSKDDLEALFRDYLGADHVLWLGKGIAGDDTHGHVDDLARFVNPETVTAVVEEDRADCNYEPLRENWERLKEMKDQDGRPLRAEPLPMPAPVIFAGQRLPASYANFYIANGLVLVPVFSDPNDRVALNTLSGLFPDRKVIGIPCRDLVLGLGTLHCMTQQQPA